MTLKKLLKKSIENLQEAVKVSVANLKSYPFVKEGLEKGTLKVFGAHYDFVDGAFELVE